MVYCSKCGTENQDDSEVCTNCGSSLKNPVQRYRRREWDWDDDFFGRRKRTWPLIFGGFLIMLGLSQLLEDVFWWFSFDTLWPVFLIGIGLVVINNGMSRRR